MVWALSLNAVTEKMVDGGQAAHELPAEPMVSYVVEWLRLGVESVGAMIVGIGVLVAFYNFIRALLAGRHGDFLKVRLSLARYLVVGLEFQLAADILSTAIAPGWDQIGKLAAIAVIRTLLNFFLVREMRDVEAGLHPVTSPTDPVAMDNSKESS